MESALAAWNTGEVEEDEFLTRRFSDSGGGDLHRKYKERWRDNRRGARNAYNPPGIGRSGGFSMTQVQQVRVFNDQGTMACVLEFNNTLANIHRREPFTSQKRETAPRTYAPMRHVPEAAPKPRVPKAAPKPRVPEAAPKPRVPEVAPKTRVPEAAPKTRVLEAHVVRNLEPQRVAPPVQKSSIKLPSPNTLQQSKPVEQQNIPIANQRAIVVDLTDPAFNPTKKNAVDLKIEEVESPHKNNFDSNIPIRVTKEEPKAQNTATNGFTSWQKENGFEDSDDFWQSIASSSQNSVSGVNTTAGNLINFTSPMLSYSENPTTPDDKQQNHEQKTNNKKDEEIMKQLLEPVPRIISRKQLNKIYAKNTLKDRGPLLFNYSVTISQNVIHKIPVHQNDNPLTLAHEFCSRLFLNEREMHNAKNNIAKRISKEMSRMKKLH